MTKLVLNDAALAELKSARDTFLDFKYAHGNVIRHPSEDEYAKAMRYLITMINNLQEDHVCGACRPPVTDPLTQATHPGGWPSPTVKRCED